MEFFNSADAWGRIARARRGPMGPDVPVQGLSMGPDAPATAPPPLDMGMSMD